MINSSENLKGFNSLLSSPSKEHTAKEIDKEINRLSRNFQTYLSNEVMSGRELTIRSAAAFFLGFLPFLITKVSLKFFKGLASGVAFCQEQNYFKLLGFFLAVPTALTAITMLVSAKVFAATQTVIWGEYVKYPTGDGPNTRVAQYGASALPSQDFKNIIVALFNPQKLSPNKLSIRQWSKITI